MNATAPLQFPAPVRDCRARLEQEPLDVDAAHRLLDVLDPPPRSPAQQTLAEACLLLDGGAPWETSRPVYARLDPFTEGEHEKLVRHPQERQQSRHRWASLFGRALHLVDGNVAARAVRRATEQATSRSYPRLCRTTARSSRVLAVEPPPCHIGRGSDRALTALADGVPFLFVHRAWLGEPEAEGPGEGYPPLTDAELLFAVGRQVEHVKGGHVTLMQLTGEEMEALVVDQLPLVVSVPLKVTTRAVGWTRLNRAFRSVGGLFGKESRAGSAIRAVGAALPDRDQETILPEVALDWVRGWVRALDYTGDRAGLLLCGNLPAACSALLRLLPVHAAQLPLVQQRGLRWFLREGEGVSASTADRLRELFRFAFSEPYLAGLVGGDGP